MKTTEELISLKESVEALNKEIKEFPILKATIENLNKESFEFPSLISEIESMKKKGNTFSSFKAAVESMKSELKNSPVFRAAIESMNSELEDFFTIKTCVNPVDVLSTNCSEITQKSSEELAAINTKVGLLEEKLSELSDSELEQVAGGDVNYFAVFSAMRPDFIYSREISCPKCGYKTEQNYKKYNDSTDYYCPTCDKILQFNILEYK